LPIGRFRNLLLSTKEHVMRRKSTFLVAAMTCLGLAISVLAQQPGQPGGRGRGGPGGPGGGPGGFFGGGGGFTSRMGLLSVEEVRKELELTDEQVDEIQKVAAAIREKYGIGGRGGPGGERGRGGGEGQRGRRGGDGKSDRASQLVPAQWYFVQAQQPGGQGRRGGGFGDITPAQRAEMERQRAERAREENAKLAEILLPSQLKRLTEIYIQRVGVAALQDDEIAKELGVNDEQKNRIAKIREEYSGKRREMFSGGRGGGGGDFEAIRAKMTELTTAENDQVLGTLTAQQKSKFEEMKGKPFAMPERGPGGPGGPGGRGRRGNDN
jgi:hypothetical protein